MSASGQLPNTPGGVTITVCTACRVSQDEGRDAQTFYDLVRTRVSETGGCRVRRTECLSVCNRPCTVAVSHPCGYTFLFGDLAGEDAADALAAFASTYVQRAYGFVPWKDRPPLLRSRIVARVPPVDWSPTDGGTP